MKQKQTSSGGRFQLWKHLFVMLLALFTGVGGAWADTVKSLTSAGTTAITAPTSGNSYVIKCSGQASQVTYMYDDNGSVAATTTLPTGTKGMAYVWTITQNEDGSTYTITNASTGKSLTFEGTSNGSAVSTSSTGTAITITVSGDNVGLCNSSSQYIDMGYNGTGASTWSGGVGGSRTMTILDANVEDVTAYTISYSFKYNDTEIATASYTCGAGDAYPTTKPSSTFLKVYPGLLDFAFPSGTVSGDESKDVTVTVKSSFPFETSTITDGAFDSDTKWYNMTLSGNYVYYDTDNSNFKANGSAASNDDTYLFAFTGDPLNGYSIYNKASGASAVVFANTPSDYDGKAMEAITDASGTWSIGANGAGYWMLASSASNAYINYRDGNFSFWLNNGATTAEGSRLTFTKVGSISELQTKLTNMIAAVDANTGTNPGNYTITDAANYAAAKDARTSTDIPTLIGYINDLSTYYTSNPVETGKYYQLVSAYSVPTNTLVAYAKSDNTLNYEVKPASADLNTLFTLTAVDGTTLTYNGVDYTTYNLTNANTGTQITQANWGKTYTVSATGTAIAFIPCSTGAFYLRSSDNDHTMACGAGGSFPAADATAGVISTYNGMDSETAYANTWYLQEVKLYTLSGTVKESETGLAGVTVTITNTATNATYSVTTDEDGVYSKDLADGTYNITFSKNGYATQTLQNVAISGATVASQDVTMVAGDIYINEGETATYSVIKEQVGDGHSLILNGGTLVLDEDLTSTPTPTVTVETASTLSINEGKTYTQGVITGDGTLTLAGAGTYNTTYTAYNATLGATLGESWTGTVATKANSNISSGSGLTFTPLVNGTSSKILLTGNTGWVKAGNTTSANLQLVNGDESNPFGFTSNGANDNQTYTFNGTITGAGDFCYYQADKGSRTTAWEFGGDLSNWTGNFKTNNTGTTTFKITKAGTVAASAVNESTGTLKVETTVDGVVFAGNISGCQLNMNASTSFGISGTPTISLTSITGVTSLNITLDDATLSTIASKVGDDDNYTLVNCSGSISATSLTVNGSSSVTLGSKTFNIMKTTSGIVLMTPLTGYTVSGTVKNSSDEAVSGATVALTGKTNGIIYTATSTADGYSISDVPNDTYTITVTSDAYATYFGAVTVSDADATADVKFYSGNIVAEFDNANPVFYRMKNVSASRYAAYAGDATYMSLTANTDASTIFYFEPVTTEGLASDAQTVKIHTITNDYALASINTFTSDGATYYIYSNDNDGYSISPTYQDGTNALNNYQGSGTQVQVWSWNDNGSNWQFEIVSPDDAFAALCDYNDKSDDGLLTGSLFGPTASQESTYKTNLNALSYAFADGWATNKAKVTTLRTEFVNSWNTTPAAGKYLIYNRAKGTWLNDPGDELSGGTCSFSTSETKLLANNVWEFIANGDAKVSNSGTQPKYQMRNRGTGRFLQIGADKGNAVAGYDHMSRESVTNVTIDPTIADKGYTTIRRNDRNGVASSGCLYLNETTLTNNTVTGNNSAQWILYPIDTDILETGTNFLLHANTGAWHGYYNTGETYLVSDIDETQELFKQDNLTNVSNSMVWQFSTGNADGTYTIGSLASIADSKYLATYKTLGDAADWQVNLSNQTGTPRYTISYDGTNGLNDKAAEGKYVDTYGIADNGSTWRLEKVARALDDAQYNLNKIIASHADATDASKLFYFNTDKYTTYSGYVSGTYTEDATGATLFFNAYKKVLAGIVNTDFNLPATGTSYYSLKNYKYNYYLQSKTNDSSTGLIGNKVFTSANILQLAFTNDGNGNVTATILDPVTNMYLKAATQSAQVQFETVAEGSTPHSFVISPSQKMDAAGKGAIAIGENDIPNSSTTFLHQGGEDSGTGIYNIVGWNVTVANANWNSAAWIVNPIDELSAELIKNGETLIANRSGHTASTDFFYLSAAGQTAITNASTAIGEEGGDALDEYKALETAINSYTSYNMPPTGRYYLKSKWTTNGTKYMTDYGSLVNITTPGYYTVWDLTQNMTDGTFNGTYQFVNEGAAYVYEPYNGSTVTHKPGKPYLCYNSNIASKSAYTYVMGGTVADDGTLTPGSDAASTPAAMEFVFNGTGDGYVSMRAQGDPYFACIATMGTGTKWVISHGSGQQYDENIQSGITNGDNQFWTVEQFTAEQEAAMFENMAKTKKVYYVGGPVTLTNISSVECLNTYSQDLTTKKATIAASTTPTEIATGVTHAGYYKDMCDELNTMLSNAETKAYVLELSTDKTFYLENLSRPSNSARLVNLKDVTTCHTVATTDTENYDSNYAQWRMEIADGKAGTFYIKNVGTGKYISSRTAGEKDMVMTTSTDDAAQIALTEVVPGVYLIYDALCASSSDETIKAQKYMTIGGSPWNLTYYNTYELSTMWKIYSVNTVETDTIKVMKSGDATKTITVGSNSYNSYASCHNVLNTRLKVNDASYKVYYGVYARFASADDATDYDGVKFPEGRLVLTLRALKTITDNGTSYYYMQGGKGYVFLDAGDGVLNVSDEYKIEFTGADITASTESTDPYYYANMDKMGDIIVPATPITATEDNWSDYYVLGYKTGAIGTWKCKTVYGTGLGFYHPRVGEVIDAGKVVLPATIFASFDWTKYNPNYTAPTSAREVQESDLGWTLELEDENGKTTNIIDIDAQGNIVNSREFIYDLNGRQLKKAQPGINIINGKKVLMK